MECEELKYLKDVFSKNQKIFSGNERTNIYDSFAQLAELKEGERLSRENTEFVSSWMLRILGNAEQAGVSGINHHVVTDLMIKVGYKTPKQSKEQQRE